MKHSDSGLRCLVHNDPACIKCATCSQWVRPECMDEECPNDHKSETLIDTLRMLGVPMPTAPAQVKGASK